MDDKELEALYGPTAAYSEHQRGETIKFRVEGQTKEGIILWVCAPAQVVEGERDHPILYIVEAPGFPLVVWPGEVVEEK